MPNSATHDRKGGLRGPDKQQDDLQDSGQGVVRDKRGQEQPADKERAQRDSSLKSQKDAAQSQPQSPGQPAHGE
jgi:hypothetical protein